MKPKLKLLAALAAICTLFAMIGMRVATYTITYDPNVAIGLFLGQAGLIEAVLADPLAIAFDDETVKAAGLVCFVVSLLLAAFGAMGALRGDFETGTEHGEERFATYKEMGALLDRRSPTNNIMFTKRSGILVHAHTKRMREAVSSLSLNVLTVGITGLGKTFNISKPEMLASIGDALKGKSCSWTRAFGHAEKRIRRPLASKASSTKERLTQHGLARKARGILGKIQEAAASLKQRAMKRLQPVANLKQKLTLPFSSAAGFIRRIAKALAAIAKPVCRLAGLPFSSIAKLGRKLKAKRFINEGFDVFNTDPKGQNLADVGHLYEAAGYKIRCFNTVDFSQSLKYNPLSYIKCRLTDIKDPEGLECALKAIFSREGFATDEDSAITPDAGYTRAGNEYLVTADLDVETLTSSYEDESEIDPQIRQDLEEIAARAGEEVLAVAKSFSYKRSTAVLTVTYKNTGWRDEEPEISVALDPALTVVEIVYAGEAGYDGDAGTVTWRPGTVAGRPKGVSDEDVKPAVLTVRCRMRLARVPDSVDLTKTVNCMAENLNEERDERSGQDPFWESTKRLAFMAYISLLFEKYESRYRTIPEMMRLLNMAKVNGDASRLSPLDVLMESWETGYLFLPRKGSGNADMRDRDAGVGDWVKIGNDPHDMGYSLALHCYHAYNSGAEETIQSVVISCHAALVKMFGEDVRELTSTDEMKLDTLGEAGQKQAVFAIVDDTDPTYGFLFALLIYQSVTMACSRAYTKHGGRLPRHVRFILDEFATCIGRIPFYARLLAVVRSRNISIHMFVQSFSQLVKNYGKEDAETIEDCCSTLLFLGAQTTENLNRIKEKLGEETVYAETYSRVFNDCGFEQTTSQNVQSHGRALKSAAQLRRQDKSTMLCFIFGQRPIQDEKIATWEHPLYCYIDPESPRSLNQPVCRYGARFDYREYLERERRRNEEKRAV